MKSHSIHRPSGALQFILICFLALLFISPYAIAREKKDDLLASADTCRKKLEASSNALTVRKNWMQCVELYVDIARQLPTSDEAAWALYRLGNLYTGLFGFSARETDLDKAIQSFEDLVKRHPDHFLADDAQYSIGIIYFHHKNDLVQAYRSFLKVEVTYPDGDMVPRARRMLEDIAIALGEKEATRVPIQEEKILGEYATVKDIRYWSSQNYTRVVIDLDRAVTYTHASLEPNAEAEKPKRIYLDLDKTHIKKNIERDIPIKDGLLQRARAALNTPDTVRVVLDIESMKDYRIFHLLDPFRIVLDVERPQDRPAKTNLAKKRSPRKVKKGIAISKEPEQDISLARQLGLGIRKIVIDPGHGGKDPGCYVGEGIYEKDVVLKAGKLLAKRMKEKFGFEVFLTRNKDIFLSLEQRTAIANMRKADLFISIHVNAHRDNRVSGIETYFLNMATDQGAITVAARENATTEKNMSDLQVIIRDLMLNNKISESSKLAHEIQHGVLSRLSGRYSKVKDLGVKQAPFYVLTGASMPAVLVEMGFITNKAERKRLTTVEYQDHVAAGICDAIENYVKKMTQALT